jgi:hypothetical protein
MEKTRPSAQLFLAKKKFMEELEAMIRNDDEVV